MRKLTSRRMILVAFASAISVNLGTAHSAGGAPMRAAAPSKPVRECAARWNLMRMDWRPTLASVSAAPECKVLLAYAYDGEVHKETVLTCTVGPKLIFSCGRYGENVTTPISDWNGRIDKLGHLSLNGVKRLPTLPLPAWARGWDLYNGYLVPFNRDGTVRKDITHEDDPLISSLVGRGECFPGRILPGGKIRAYDCGQGAEGGNTCFSGLREPRSIWLCQNAFLQGGRSFGAGYSEAD